MNIPFGPVVVVSIGAFIGAYGVVERARSATALRFPFVVGTVSWSVIEEYTDSDGYTMFRPSVAVDYEVAGISYTTRNVAEASYGTSWASGAARLVDRYPLGSRIAVFVNPDDHSAGVVDPTAHMWLAYLFMAVGAAVMIAGFAWYWLRFR